MSGHLKVNVHDEAYARLHLGVIGENVDIIQASLCFKGDTNYNINILQVSLLFATVSPQYIIKGLFYL